MREMDHDVADVDVIAMIKTITDQRQTYGYRRVTALLRKKIAINHKRVYRLMKEHGLLLQKYGARPARVHDGKVATLKSNVRWCSDGFRLQCWNGEHVEVAFSMDCHDREIISWVTSSRGIDGELVRDLMAESVELRFGGQLPFKVQWLTDNGPGYVARETVFFGRSLGLEICTTAPYSPESNGMAEAFVKTLKRDYAYVNDLSSAERVLEQLPGWFKDYNEQAPHKALGMMSPREYRSSNRAS
jgi:putative transposase